VDAEVAPVTSRCDGCSTVGRGRVAHTAVLRVRTGAVRTSSSTLTSCPTRRRGHPDRSGGTAAVVVGRPGYRRGMTVPCAQLRIFAPLASFPPGERKRWAAYVAGGGGMTRGELATLEDAAALSTAVAGRVPRTVEAALVRRAGERVLVCPVEPDVRAAVAFASFGRTVPPALVASFVPSAAARTRFERLARDHRPPRILDAPWSVPLPWFLAFAPDERRLTDPPEGRGPRLVYLTTVGQARARVARALAVIEEAIEDSEQVLGELAGLDAWLEPCDPTSVLELDYAALARRVAPAALRADRSCAELWAAVGALEDGDLLAAAAGYAVVRSRWSARRAAAHVN
jgi:hypothetical protein